MGNPSAIPDISKHRFQNSKYYVKVSDRNDSYSPESDCKQNVNDFCLNSVNSADSVEENIAATNAMQLLFWSYLLEI